MSTTSEEIRAPRGTGVADFGAGPVLAACRCPACGVTRYPPRALCPDDLSEMELLPLGQEGVLVVAVTVFRPPLGFTVGFCNGYVDMPEGVRVFAQFDPEDSEQLVPGARVAWRIETVRTEPQPVLGPVFHPVPSSKE